MDDVMNAMRREAARVGARTAQPRMAIVSSYNPDTYQAKVKLMPEGIETGWAPIVSPQVGNGWGNAQPPSPGDQVFVVFQEGAGGSPVIIGSVYSDEDRAVAPEIGGTPSGEWRAIGKSGARMRLLENGTVEIRQKAGVQVLINEDGTVDINAETVRIGKLGATFRRLVNDLFMVLFNSHVHGNGPPPTQKMTDEHLTANLKGA